MPVKSIAKKPKRDDKFITEVHKRRYEDETSRRSVSGEKGFQFEDKEDFGLPEGILAVIRRRHWETFARHPLSMMPGLVKEFYANFSNGETTWVRVRMRQVRFSAETINNFYSVPNVSDGYDAYVLSLGETEWNQILNRVCIEGTTWKKSAQGALTINKSSFLPEAKIWYHFVATRLFPSTHGQTVTQDRVVLVDAILGDRPLNVGRIIYQQINFCATRQKGSLFFPALISSLCLNSDVPVADEDERVRIGGMLTAYNISRIMKATFETEDTPPPREDVQRKDPTNMPSAESQTSIEKRLSLLETQQAIFMMQQQKVWRYMKKRDAFLDFTAGRKFSIPSFPDEVFEQVSEEDSSDNETTESDDADAAPGPSTANQPSSTPEATPEAHAEPTQSNEEDTTPDAEDVQIVEEKSTKQKGKMAQTAGVAKRRAGLRSSSRFH